MEASRSKGFVVSGSTAGDGPAFEGRVQAIAC